jgi:hypothetical protein
LMDDDDLSKGEEGSLCGGGFQSGPPTLATLVELISHPQCQAPTQVTVSDGAKAACICGCSVGDCQRHSTHHISGRYHHPVGVYVSMTDVVRGFQGHGRIWTCMTRWKNSAIKQTWRKWKTSQWV